ncbi:MAG: SDR family oxidoreductase [Bdellovibrionaceae bacterium]|nr:SDR family oxidoreductase [Pseudobdellovibrionaceae bacterium]
MKIKDQNFFITGANRGIGLAVAEMAAKEGAHVHLVIRNNDEELVSRLKKLGAKSVTTWISDLSKKDNVINLVEKLQNQEVDIFFNNAGVLTGGLLEEQTIDEIYNLVQVNISSLIHLTHGVLPGMLSRKKGKIINNSSVSALMHFPCATTYAASKAAVWAFTECLQTEIKDTGVTSLCLITPGIKTRMFDEIEVKYGNNFEVPTDHISTEEYAHRIKQAIFNDDNLLQPKGSTRWGLRVAKYYPSLFFKVVSGKFKRQP